LIDLIKLSRQSHFPLFDLRLSDGSNLTQLNVVRCVANKRLVCSGLWNNSPVFAKLFIGHHAKRYAIRDAAGVEHLSKAGILTPPLLHTASNEAVHILIFKAILDGQDAEAIYHASTFPQRLALAKKVIATVAAHHNAGLLQTDLYLKNFLVEGDQIYTLDGDAIKPLPKFLASRAALNNLALLLSKFDVLEMAQWLKPLAEIYQNSRQGHTKLDLDRLRYRVMQYRHRTVASYANKKVFRQCTDVTVSRSWRHFLAMTRDGFIAPLQHQLRNAPDTLIDGPDRQILKNGKTCTVGLAEINARKIVVKRYNIKSFWHLLGRFWRPSRAATSWSNANRLTMHGIATAKPIALMEQRFGPLRGKAYFLAEYIESVSLADLMQDNLLSQAQKQSVCQAIAELLYKLSLLQIVHGDMKASNIHIENSRPVLIDLDSLQEYRCKAWFAKGHVRDLKRLIKNWDAQPEIRHWLIAALQKVYGDHPLLARALKQGA
jgi:tRNA A-37 threonylcarbamoyl transferase component Bud32